MIKVGMKAPEFTLPDKNSNMAKKLLNDGRINYMVKSNYDDGSEIDEIVKKTIKSMVINTELKNISYKYELNKSIIKTPRSGSFFNVK